jgi:diguanylate cyclase (GGDEF)-like protein
VSVSGPSTSDAAEPQPSVVDEPRAIQPPPPAIVREELVRSVHRNITSSPFLLLPAVLVASWAYYDEVDRSRLGWWVLSAVAFTLIGLATVLIPTGTRREAAMRHIEWPLRLSMFMLSVVFGLASWVGTSGDTEVATLFILLPATYLSIAVVVSAGCRDILLVMIVPTFVMTFRNLYVTGDDQLRGIAVMLPAYALAMVALHVAVSRIAMRAVIEGSVADRLRQQFNRDRQELVHFNDRLHETNQQLAYQATHDPLTGLLNRRGALEVLDQSLLRCRHGEKVALLFLDLDRFKSVNDTLGHRGGDRFICAIADRIGRSVAEGEMAGRIGGDEFIVVLPGLDEATATAVANRLIGNLAQPVQIDGRDIDSSASIGIAVAPQHGTSSSALLRNANAALYRAKTGGRSRVDLFDGDMQRELTVRVETERDLRRAFDNGEIVAFFQPEMDASSGAVVGAEITMSWRRSDGQVISGAELAEIVRQSGLSERLAEMVLAAARYNVRRFATLGLPPGFRFRLNARDVANERKWRLRPIDELLQGIDPELVTIDVDEATVADDMPSAAASIAAFRARGGRVCLEDFARGVSSLRVLRRVPIDEVRFDRVSIDSITAHPHDRAIVRSIIRLARELGLSVSASGIDTGAQADALIALGCVRQQGAAHALSLNETELEAFLAQRFAQEIYTKAAQIDWDPDASI